MTAWEYTSIPITSDAEAVVRQLSQHGVEGWEAISVGELGILLKRPLDVPDPPDDPSPGWYPDPNGRHDQRWFDGLTWTYDVVDHDGERQVDSPAPDSPRRRLLTDE